MSTFTVDIEIGDPQGERWEKLSATVGTTQALAWAPREVLERLGVQPEKRISLRHLDGRLIKRDVAQTQVRIGQKTQIVTVVFGEKRDSALVGSETLQEMSLRADIDKGKITPIADAISSQ
jgi:predicted aspartyl protease